MVCAPGRERILWSAVISLHGHFFTVDHELMSVHEQASVFGLAAGNHDLIAGLDRISVPAGAAQAGGRTALDIPFLAILRLDHHHCMRIGETEFHHGSGYRCLASLGPIHRVMREGTCGAQKSSHDSRDDDQLSCHGYLPIECLRVVVDYLGNITFPATVC